MTSITTDTNVDQTYIDSNSGPFSISNGATVTLTSDLSLDQSNNKRFQAAGNMTINGDGYKATLINFDFGGDHFFCRDGPLGGDTGNYNITIEKVGVIRTITTGSSGSVFKNNGNSTNPNIVKIKNCYYIGILNSNSAAGIAQGGTDNNIYIQNCYVIGNVSNTSSGGIIGSFFGASGATVLLTNCYHIGSVSGTNAGAITGASAGNNGGSVYLYNCYHSSGDTIGSVGSSVSYVGSKRIYDYNGSWSDSSAGTAGLSTSSLSTSDMLNSTNWSGSGTYNLTSTDLSNAGISNGESTMFSFSANTPYGITSYTVNPYQSSKYSSATSQAANCFCAGTKITLKNGKKINIELVQQGDEVMTPHGITKKVLHVGKLWFNGNSQKHYPYLIPKDYFEEGKPCEDTYVSGAHSLLFSKAQGELLGLPDGRTKERGNGLDLFLIKSFAKKTEYQKVCVLKGEKCPYGFNYYHLVVEDNYGFIANNLPSESLELKDFKANFEEINKNRIEEIN